VLYQDQWYTVGETPERPDIRRLGEWLAEQPGLAENSPDPLYVTDHLPELYFPAKSFATQASGILAFAFSHEPLGLVVYFRPETLQTLTWAGDPQTLPIVQGPHGPRLSPRKSFELWTETVQGRSLPWEKVEMDSVRGLRHQILSMVLAGAEQVNTVRTELESTKATAASEIFKANEKLRIAVEAGDLGTWDYWPAKGELEWSERCNQLLG
jgi:light-regulated signal transduction histidine kinase (bacteriophytochrome)